MTNLDLAIVHYLDTEADLGAATTASRRRRYLDVLARIAGKAAA